MLILVGFAYTFNIPSHSCIEFETRKNTKDSMNYDADEKTATKPKTGALYIINIFLPTN